MSLQSICSSMRCTDVHTDEDYLCVLQRQQRFYIGMLIVGILTMTIACLAEIFHWETALTSYQYGFYSGAGGGMIGGALVFLLRIRQRMKSPEKLRKARVAASDERTMEISRRAMAAAGYVLLLALYLTCMIGGLFFPEFLIVLAGLACVFLLTYVISFFIYNKLM